MKAVIVKQPGGADQLSIEEQPKPVPNADEILVKVQAAAINRTDILNRERSLTYIESPILGVEVAGVVEEAGKNTTILPGTRVMGLVNGGGYAEYAVMPADRAMIIPENLSFTEAAAIPEVFLTAYQTLYWLAQLKQRETVLIHAGGSGVGTAAIQLAHILNDAYIMTTAGSEEKLTYAKSLGADVVINYKEQDFSKEILQVTKDQGVDVILDFIGASYWEKNLRSIAVDGRWVLIGILGGDTVEKVRLMDLMQKRVQLTGTLLTPRSDAYKAKLTREFIQIASPYFTRGDIKPIIDRVYPMEDIRLAHERMENNKNIGKIVISI